MTRAERIRIEKRAESVRKTYENTYNSKYINAEKMAWLMGILIDEREDVSCDICLTINGKTGRRELLLRKGLNTGTQRRLILSEIGYYLLHYRGGDLQHQLPFLMMAEPEVVWFVDCLF